MSIQTCPTCGEPVKVVGNGTTQHYESVARSLLLEALEAMEERLTDNAGGIGLKQDRRDTAGILFDAAHRIRQQLGGAA